MEHILNRQNTVLNKFIAEIRDHSRSRSDSMRFRRNLERIGELMAYEISKRFALHAPQRSRHRWARPKSSSTTTRSSSPRSCAQAFRSTRAS